MMRERGLTCHRGETLQAWQVMPEHTPTAAQRAAADNGANKLRRSIAGARHTAR